MSDLSRLQSSQSSRPRELDLIRLADDAALAFQRNRQLNLATELAAGDNPGRVALHALDENADLARNAHELQIGAIALERNPSPRSITRHLGQVDDLSTRVTLATQMLEAVPSSLTSADKANLQAAFQESRSLAEAAARRVTNAQNQLVTIANIHVASRMPFQPGANPVAAVVGRVTDISKIVQDTPGADTPAVVYAKSVAHSEVFGYLEAQKKIATLPVTRKEVEMRFARVRDDFRALRSTLEGRLAEVNANMPNPEVYHQSTAELRARVNAAEQNIRDLQQTHQVALQKVTAEKEQLAAQYQQVENEYRANAASLQQEIATLSEGIAIAEREFAQLQAAPAASAEQNLQNEAVDEKSAAKLALHQAEEQLRNIEQEWNTAKFEHEQNLGKIKAETAKLDQEKLRIEDLEAELAQMEGRAAASAAPADLQDMIVDEEPAVEADAPVSLEQIRNSVYAKANQAAKIKIAEHRQLLVKMKNLDKEALRLADNAAQLESDRQNLQAKYTARDAQLAVFEQEVRSQLVDIQALEARDQAGQPLNEAEQTILAEARRIGLEERRIRGEIANVQALIAQFSEKAKSNSKYKELVNKRDNYQNAQNHRDKDYAKKRLEDGWKLVDLKTAVKAAEGILASKQEDLAKAENGQGNVEEARKALADAKAKVKSLNGQIVVANLSMIDPRHEHHKADKRPDQGKLEKIENGFDALFTTKEMAEVGVFKDDKGRSVGPYRKLRELNLALQNLDADKAKVMLTTNAKGKTDFESVEKYRQLQSQLALVADLRKNRAVAKKSEQAALTKRLEATQQAQLKTAEKNKKQLEQLKVKEADVLKQLKGARALGSELYAQYMGQGVVAPKAAKPAAPVASRATTRVNAAVEQSPEQAEQIAKLRAEIDHARSIHAENLARLQAVSQEVATNFEQRTQELLNTKNAAVARKSGAEAQIAEESAQAQQLAQRTLEEQRAMREREVAARKADHDGVQAARKQQLGALQTALNTTLPKSEQAQNLITLRQRLETAIRTVRETEANQAREVQTALLQARNDAEKLTQLDAQFDLSVQNAKRELAALEVRLNAAAAKFGREEENYNLDIHLIESQLANARRIVAEKEDESREDVLLERSRRLLQEHAERQAKLQEDRRPAIAAPALQQPQQQQRVELTLDLRQQPQQQQHAESTLALQQEQDLFPNVQSSELTGFTFDRPNDSKRDRPSSPELPSRQNSTADQSTRFQPTSRLRFDETSSPRTQSTLNFGPSSNNAQRPSALNFDEVLEKTQVERSSRSSARKPSAARAASAVSSSSSSAMPSAAKPLTTDRVVPVLASTSRAARAASPVLQQPTRNVLQFASTQDARSYLLSQDQTQRQASAATSKQETVKQDGRLAFDEPTERRTKLAFEATSKQERRLAFDEPTERRTKLAFEATSKQARRLDFEGQPAQKSKLAFEATSKQARRLDFEGQPAQKSKLAFEATSKQARRLDFEGQPAQKSKLAFEGSSKQGPSKLTQPTSQKADLQTMLDDGLTAQAPTKDRRESKREKVQASSSSTQTSVAAGQKPPARRFSADASTLQQTKKLAFGETEQTSRKPQSKRLDFGLSDTRAQHGLRFDQSDKSKQEKRLNFGA